MYRKRTKHLWYDPPMTSTAFHDRLQNAAGELSYRQLGDMTDTHPETVRRYMQGQAPSAAFITNLCHAKGISGQWLLSGQGPMRVKDLTTHALKGAAPDELMGAVANIISELIERMDRMERVVQTLETRLNVAVEHKPGSRVRSVDGRDTPDPQSAHQARRIGDAVAERPPEADDEPA